jgi:hypothetical protein
MQVPVLFLVFNRPYHTRQTFEALRKIKPRYLYIGADGPREGNARDVKKCQEVRNIATAVDWECEIKTLFNQKNLGTKIAVSNAITWFFNEVEEGIIIEDDCVPDPTFYNFASAMLDLYRHDERIMHINGTNLLMGKQIVTDSSYYYSNLCQVWGWATWRRAWQHFDAFMKDFEAIDKVQLLSTISDDPAVSNYWYGCLDSVYRGEVDTWDYQWFYAFWKKRGTAVTPSLNMVSNIGFGEEGTRTIIKFNPFSKMKRYPMKKIIHPPAFAINESADRYSNEQKFRELNPSFWIKVQFKFDLMRKKYLKNR